MTSKTTSNQEIFSQHGLLSQYLKDYSFRPQQLTMADAVTEALDYAGSAVIEAGTGVGKTLAYLLPVINSGQKVVVSTGTRNLQDQIYFVDLPLALQVLKSTREVALLKGRSNYLCQQRLLQFQAERHHSADLARDYQVIFDWGQLTQVGDISEVEAIHENSQIWPYVTSTRDNCLGIKCPEYNHCWLLKARKRAQKADVVVINHHLLFADMILKEEGFGELLPQAQAFIIDEAHQLPEVAGQYFGCNLSSRQLNELAADIQSSLDLQSRSSDEQSLPLKLVEAVSKLQSFVLHSGERQLPLARLIHQSEIGEIVFNLTEFVETLISTIGELDSSNPVVVQLHVRAMRILELLRQFCQVEKDCIQWVDVYPRRFVFRMVPLSVSDPYQLMISRYSAACVYTSATLTAQNGFEHFCRQLGLQDVSTFVLDSPYNYKENALLYLPQLNVDVQAEDYTRCVIDTCLPLLQANNGNAFLLFTSHNALQVAANVLREMGRFNLFVQGESSKRDLIYGFRQTDNSVLIGTHSFWEGVDVKGLDLSLVVIDKLPFASPMDPVINARARVLEEQGENPFMSFQLPQAIVTLKQGVGRLIRHEHDKGVVVLMDPRVQSRRYGSLVLKHLPPMMRTSDPQTAIDFLKRLQGSSEHIMH